MLITKKLGEKVIHFTVFGFKVLLVPIKENNTNIYTIINTNINKNDTH